MSSGRLASVRFSWSLSITDSSVLSTDGLGALDSLLFFSNWEPKLLGSVLLRCRGNGARRSSSDFSKWCSVGREQMKDSLRHEHNDRFPLIRLRLIIYYNFDVTFYTYDYIRDKKMVNTRQTSSYQTRSGRILSLHRTSHLDLVVMVLPNVPALKSTSKKMSIKHLIKDLNDFSCILFFINITIIFIYIIFII